MRIAIIEDNPRYRESLIELFSLWPGFEAAASFSNARTALIAATQQKQLGLPPAWDLVLTDLQMPEMNGIEGTRQLKAIYPDLPVIVLTVFEDSTAILEAICAGADGYLLKRSPAAEIVEQVRSVAAGGAPLTPGVARTMMNMLREQAPAARSPLPERVELTDRERDVLSGLVKGLAYKEVADELGVSIDTVRTHIRALYKKLQVQSATAAVSKAIKERLV